LQLIGAAFWREVECQITTHLGRSAAAAFWSASG
jgi:hypothetical protein